MANMLTKIIFEGTEESLSEKDLQRLENKIIKKTDERDRLPGNIIYVEEKHFQFHPTHIDLDNNTKLFVAYQLRPQSNIIKVSN